MFRESAHSNFTQRNVFQARPDNVDAGPSRSSAPTTNKAMHPFFSRGFRAKSPISKPSSPVPPAHEPRHVAYYSSTSASEMTDSQNTASTFGSQPGPSSQTSLKGKGKSVPDMESLVQNVAKLQVSGTAGASGSLGNGAIGGGPPPQTKPAGKGSVKPAPQPGRTFAHLPTFSYRTYTDRPPRVAYTTSMAEAEDLLGCLRGNVMGFDLEWPASGFLKTSGGNGKKRVPVGATWNAAKGKYDFSQARTALAQICDHNLVVLIHMRSPKGQSVPSRRLLLV